MLYTCRVDDGNPFFYNITLANGDYEIIIHSQDEKWHMFRGPWGGRAFWMYVEENHTEPFDYIDVFGRFISTSPVVFLCLFETDLGWENSTKL